MLVGLVAAGLDVLPFFVGWCIIVRVFNKTIKVLIFVLNVFLLWQFVCAHPTLCLYQPRFRLFTRHFNSGLVTKIRKNLKKSGVIELSHVGPILDGQKVLKIRVFFLLTESYDP